MPDKLTSQLLTLTSREDIPKDARDVISATIAQSPLQTDVWIYRAVV